MTVWYTAPTAVRMLMRAGAELPRALRPLARCASSRASASRSTPRRASGAARCSACPIHDNWWQTETGGIMIANYAAHGHPAGLDGPAAARGSRRRSCAAADGGSRRGAREPDARGRARAAAGLAVDVPRLPRRRGALPQVLRRRLVPHRRSRAARRRRLLLVRRPRRRRDQVRGPPDRPLRGRERAARAPGGRRGRRDRQARSGRRRDRQGVRLAASTASSRARRSRRELLALRAHAARPGGRAEGDRVPRRLPQDAQREDHAPAAARARARPARGRHSRRWRATHERVDAARAARPRARARSCCARCCASAASRRSAPSSTRRRRSAASCTSTSARRRSRSA